jgi:hypothetical protein
VSTEGQLDPTSSKQWQMSRAQAIIGPRAAWSWPSTSTSGRAGPCRGSAGLESAVLLEAFKRPDSGFDAVVIGEPARAFYAFPVFVHYGIELSVPEIGGKVDPGSHAHDLVMSL